MEAATSSSPRRFPLYLILVVGVFLLIGGISLLSNSGNKVTSFLDSNPTSLRDIIPSLKTVPSLGANADGALFDISLTIPEKSQSLSPEEELLLSIELTNIGSQETNVALTYLITRKEGGEIVYIEHENRMVQTQDQFLKSLLLQELPAGNYYVYVHILYNDAT